MSQPSPRRRGFGRAPAAGLLMLEFGGAYDYLLWGRQEVAVVVRDVGRRKGKSGV